VDTGSREENASNKRLALLARSGIVAHDTACTRRLRGGTGLRRSGAGRYLARVTAMVEPRHAASMTSADRSLSLSYSRDSR
jgi:hypothetical protein